MGEERKNTARVQGNCEHCGKEWQPERFASVRRCAFTEETFNGNNWQCGLVSSIRRAMGDGDGCHTLHFRNDDIGTYGALVVAVPAESEEWGGGYRLSGLLIGSWYKNRGECEDLKWGYRAHGGEHDDRLTRSDAALIAAWLRDLEDVAPVPALQS